MEVNLSKNKICTITLFLMDGVTIKATLNEYATLYLYFSKTSL